VRPSGARRKLFLRLPDSRTPTIRKLVGREPENRMRKLRRLICILAIAICPSVNTSAQEIAGSIHANFRLPNNDISSPNVAEISEAPPGRLGQLALKFVF
jgi:hypothetical protein